MHGVRRHGGAPAGRNGRAEELLAIPRISRNRLALPCGIIQAAGMSQGSNARNGACGDRTAGQSGKEPTLAFGPKDQYKKWKSVTASADRLIANHSGCRLVIIFQSAHPHQVHIKSHNMGGERAALQQLFLEGAAGRARRAVTATLCGALASYGVVGAKCLETAFDFLIHEGLLGQGLADIFLSKLAAARRDGEGARTCGQLGHTLPCVSIACCSSQM